jgi:D-3-phosphoglycerate dehydrogenase
MKISVVEPLAVEQTKLEEIVKNTLPKDIDIVYYNTRTTDEEELIKRSKDADIIVLGNIPFGKNILEKCKNLKMVAIAFTGVDHVDVSYCHENNILVTNCAGYSTVAVSELVFGLLIDLYRNIILCNDVVRKEGTKDGLVGFELEGKTMGIVGTGAIGLRTAMLAKAFGMKVIAYSRTKKNNGIEYKTLEEVMKEADVISLHVPVTDETRGMIGKEQLELMKKDAVLINTARGPVVDTQALADALNNDKIAGAAVDVFDTEPPIKRDNPLITAKNTVLTPHVAFATKESMIKRAEIEFSNIAAYLAGESKNIIK